MSREPPVVVHLRRRNGAVVVDCDVYIGRAMHQGGWQLPASKWANPFRMGCERKDDPAERARVLASYESHVRSRPELMAALPELGGKRLGCWCAPLPCHGHVLARLLEERAAAAAGDGRGAAAGDGRGAAAGDEPAGRAIPDDDPLWQEIGLS